MGKGKTITGVTSQFYHCSFTIKVISSQQYHRSIVAGFCAFSFKLAYSFIHIVTSLKVTKLVSVISIETFFSYKEQNFSIINFRLKYNYVAWDWHLVARNFNLHFSFSQIKAAFNK